MDISLEIIMKGFGLSLIILIISILYLDAFLAPLHPQTKARKDFQVFEFRASNEVAETKELEHKDILWKVRPTPEVSRIKRLWLRFAANLIRLDCILKQQEPPLVLCPKGGQAVLEAHCRTGKRGRYQRIGRFGFTTTAGPSNQPIQDTVHDLYGLRSDVMVRVGAIIYMVVEEKYRKKQVGTLALQVISLIQSIQACDFTVLVVDDDGSGKLIDWYVRNGYSKAPKLQEVLGSPQGIHGVSMIAPCNRVLPHDCKIKWW